MSRRDLTYFIFVLLLACSGCITDAQKELTKWNVTLKNTDKTPYGTWLAYQSLKYYFPDSKIEALSTGFKYTNMDAKIKYADSNGRSMIIFEGMYFNLTDLEWDELKEFIKNGNEVIVFCSWLDNKIEEEMNCHKEGNGNEINKFYANKTDFDNIDELCLSDDRKKKYGYEGRSIKGFFTFKDDSELSKTTEQDSSQDTVTAPPPTPDTLGFAGNHPDFVRYKIGSGHLTLHAAPLALSNYFLLQNGNENYLTAIWQTFPKDVSHIYWNDFYVREAGTSSMDILWRYPATRYALILAISALLIYILFESKRKQRIIPVIAPLKNDSVSFVETVGRLYYNKGDHNNLAEKMVQQFLEWVRTHYLLNTNLLNENFIQQLTIKSGQPEASVRALLEMISELRTGTIKPDDAYLYQLYTTIQKFYK
jgi:hypothetical protein